MLDLKKYLNLKDGEIFMVAGYSNLEYRVRENVLEYRHQTQDDSDWFMASESTLLRLIMDTPKFLVRSHRALVPTEIKQLQALLDLNLQYIAKDPDGFTCAYISKPNKDNHEWFPAQEDDAATDVFPIPGSCIVSRLCRWADDEPLNIATTLEAGYVRMQGN